MTLLKQIFIFLLLSCLCTVVYSAEEVDSITTDDLEVWDGGKVNYRQSPYQKIEQWQTNPRYDYDRDSGPGILDYIMSRIFNWLVSVTSDKSWGFYVALTIGGLLILFLLLKILNIPVSGFFVLSRNQEVSNWQFEDEGNEIASEKLEEMLKMYRENQAWRDAVRIMFLLYLRELHDRGSIAIRSFKTNYDYFREIDLQEEKENFQKRMQLFDYVWYGHAEITSSQFVQVEQIFADQNRKGGGNE